MTTSFSTRIAAANLLNYTKVFKKKTYQNYVLSRLFRIFKVDHIPT